jgi:3-hydroxybutyryl-CoA dehydrogenase
MNDRRGAAVTKRVGLIGAGTMGVGIAYVFAAAGCEVVVAEPSAARVEALMSVLAEQAAQGVARGKLTADAAAAVGTRVTTVSGADDLPEALDLIIESAPESAAIKIEVLRAAELRRPAVLATNTSSISVTELAKQLRHPDLFFGMHFFNPVWSLPLVELITGASTADHAIEVGSQFADLIGKEWLVVRDSPGFATSRLDVTTALEAMRMFEEGVATAADIDKAIVTAYRHPVGPLRLSDIVGLDVRLDIALQLEGSLGQRFTPPEVLRRMVADGDLGQKSGRGFFEW